MPPFDVTTGRRQTLIYTSVPWATSFLMVGFSQGNKYLLLGGRFLMGAMVGVCIPAAQVYIGECSSPRVRGALGSLTALFLAGGILLTYIIGDYTLHFLPCYNVKNLN